MVVLAPLGHPQGTERSSNDETKKTSGKEKWRGGRTGLSLEIGKGPLRTACPLPLAKRFQLRGWGCSFARFRRSSRRHGKRTELCNRSLGVLIGGERSSGILTHSLELGLTVDSSRPMSTVRAEAHVSACCDVGMERR